MKTALIYRNEILPISETFIKAQVGALKRFRPLFVGAQEIASSLSLPQEAIIAADHGRFPCPVQRRLYQIAGLNPAFYKQTLVREFEVSRPALLHAHFAIDAVTALPLAKHLDVPFIVTLHGYDVTVSDSRWCRSVRGCAYLLNRRKLWHRASMFICVSDFIRRKAIELGFPKEKLRLHYIGVDRRQFVPGDENRRRGLILFVGRLVEKKGCEYLIRAMASIQTSRPDAELIVIGDGPLRNSLEALAHAQRIRCHFLGPQPSERIQYWLRRARVFCAPSVTAATGDSEGLGMVFAEALATGTPVASFSHGGIPEIVRHRETGLLAPERNYSSLACHILQLLNDDFLWGMCSRNGITSVRDHFDLENQTQVLEHLYEEVLSVNKTSLQDVFEM